MAPSDNEFDTSDYVPVRKRLAPQQPKAWGEGMDVLPETWTFPLAFMPHAFLT